MKSDYAGHMDKNAPHLSYAAPDLQAGASLDRVREAVSFVDSLMAMPVPGEDESSAEWDAAVARRLEYQLARTMRSIIERDEQGRKSA